MNEYDMINDLFTANDGDLRDGNAQDPGDAVNANECGYPHNARDSSWHGTHVGGTVAAVSNNAMGVTGVAWNVGLIPVRVLGKCGGWSSDIADGIRWAAGLNVPGVPNNLLPADVINMSLGSSSPGACGNTYQTAIDAAFNAGTTIVTSAGNSNDNANYQPGNCNNVISVAASANDGARAYYSNFGATVDITAPGGDGCNPINDNYPSSLADCEGGIWDVTRMVLSTHNAGTSIPAADNYNWLQGTSMSSPHVAGLVALIKSVNPNLSPAEVEQIIKNTAEPFATVPDHQCDTNLCGAGYANATAALQHTLVTLGPDLIFSNGFESDIIFKNGFE
ncbi:S8 family peptidase [Marinicella pacifica]|uniref:S8 family peptidase n=1 Tax=Marinicella pacifica TaxID=1171543 RepID=UPI001669F5F0|nr:S8 family peptidase [Marinicella pacifica]